MSGASPGVSREGGGGLECESPIGAVGAGLWMVDLYLRDVLVGKC